MDYIIIGITYDIIHCPLCLMIEQHGQELNDVMQFGLECFASKGLRRLDIELYQGESLIEAPTQQG